MPVQWTAEIDQKILLYVLPSCRKPTGEVAAFLSNELGEEISSNAVSKHFIELRKRIALGPEPADGSKPSPAKPAPKRRRNKDPNAPPTPRKRKSTASSKKFDLAALTAKNLEADSMNTNLGADRAYPYPLQQPTPPSTQQSTPSQAPVAPVAPVVKMEPQPERELGIAIKKETGPNLELGIALGFERPDHRRWDEIDDGVYVTDFEEFSAHTSGYCHVKDEPQFQGYYGFTGEY
ncbi:hypothetical protein BJ508DRAFT_304003 [Ascobolus immersus RN42]|uniref:Uncharacterized protein n=1 Tax=Ascobolus immersus RN42 TaxID=1160509 RepID=A0A3N4IFE8_ASCIM|nr:hypothetical protein BJ508DRAFT_304003 [Ascobolus immersus RN42]